MPKYPTINYIGNKNKISSWIVDSIPKDCNKVLDMFSGGGSISYELKLKGFEVISNDILYSNYVIAKALIENKNEILLLDDINSIHVTRKDIENIYTNIKFLENLVYFDYEVKELSSLLAISKKMSGYKKYIFLSLLRRAMIRKIPYSRMNIKWEEIVKLRDEQYSYKKYGRYRSYHNMTFKYHIEYYLDEYNSSVFNNKKNNLAMQMDCLDLIRMLPNNIDVVYLDPPYPSTMNNYLSFYGYFDIINENLVQQKLNLTNNKTFLNNLDILLGEIRKKSRYVMMSLNNKTKPNIDEILLLLTKYSDKVTKKTKNHVYKVTGKQNKNNNIEILLIAEFN